MNLAQELERLTKLHAEGALTAEEFARAKSQLLSTPAFSKFAVKGIRRESPRKFFGLPLWGLLPSARIGNAGRCADTPAASLR